ncbi:hypothetical protein BN133_3983 [Cronobacter dublinensis 582]|nr:hypothetical protein BN133_3983 [Cronobacter dublinensis 582]
MRLNGADRRRACHKAQRLQKLKLCCFLTMETVKAANL